MRAVAVLLVVTLVAVTGCASSTPPPPPAPRTFDHLRQLAIVVSGESTFSMATDNAEPGRTFNQILGWGIFGSDASWMRPVAELVHRGINWLLDLDREKEAKADLGDLTPRSAVAAAFVRALEDSGRFDEIRAYGREPVGEDRRRADAIVRITVPTWGFVRVQEGDPERFSAFADVRAEMSAPGAGVTIWNATEDVTGAERLPVTVFTRDREFARAQLLAVLERAGQRLASELLYERGAGQ